MGFSLSAAWKRVDLSGRILKLLCKYPIVILVSLLALPIVASILSAFFPVQVDFGITGFRVRDNSIGQHYDALSAAVHEEKEYMANVNPSRKNIDPSLSSHLSDSLTSSSERLRYTTVTRTEKKWRLQVIFESKGENMLTSENLEVAHSVFRKLINVPGYNDYCTLCADWDNDCRVKDPYNYCHIPDSLNSFLFYSSQDDEMRPLEDGLMLALLRNIYDFTDPSFSKDNLVSKLYRIQFTFGAPLPGFAATNDREAEQKKIVLEFLKKYEKLIDEENSHSTNPFRIYYGGDLLTQFQIERSIYRDSMFAIGSIGLIFILMRVHMGSFLLSFLGLFLITISFPATYFVYRVILGIQSVGVLNAISLFLITGVGVDDVFVFYDVFCQYSKSMPIEKKIALTYPKAAKATFITSATTAAAFIMNVFSSIPALRLFGFYMCIIVSMNWILVATIFPSVLIVWDTKIRYRKWCNCISKLWQKRDNKSSIYSSLGTNTTSANDESENNENTNNDNDNNNDESYNPSNLEESQEMNLLSLSGDSESSIIDEEVGFNPSPPAVTHRPVVLFFKDKFAPFLFKFRFVFLFLFVVLLGLCGWQASGMRPSTSPPGFFPSDSNIQWFLDWQNYAKPSTGYAKYNYDIPVYTTTSTSSTSSTSTTGYITTGTYTSTTGKAASSSSSSSSATSSSSSYPSISTTGKASSSGTYTSTTGKASTSTSTSTSTSGVPTNPPTKPPTPTPTNPPTTPAPTVPPIPTNPPSSSTSSTSASTSTSTSASSSSSSSSTTGRPTDPPTTPAPTMPPPTPTPTLPPTPTSTPTLPPTLPPTTRPTPRPTSPPTTPRPTPRPTLPPSTPRPTPRPTDPPATPRPKPPTNGPTSTPAPCVPDVWTGNADCIGNKPTFSNNNIMLYVVWGIKGIDREHADLNDPFSDYTGDAVYYDKFDLTNKDALRYLLNIPRTLTNKSNEILGDAYAFQMNSVLVDFFYLYPNALDMQEWEVVLLFGRFVLGLTTQRSRTNDVGIRIVGNSYEFLWIRFAFKINVTTSVPSFQGINSFNAWEKMMVEISKDAPVALGPSFQSSETWLRVVTEVAAVQNIVSGLIVSTLIAVLAALAFTKNIFIAFIVLLVLIGIVLSCLAFFSLAGWTLGVIEAISITVLVGLSVDYILHLADVYAHSKAKSGNRYDRTAEALTEMGISVVGGALTTIASSAMLLFCSIQIFSKFGIIVTINTILSIVLALFVFCPLMMTIGPQNDQGDIVKLTQKIVSKFRRT